MTASAKLPELAKLVRYFILMMTTEAGSGHLTSSLSATDLMSALFFEKLRFDLNDVENPNNDRVIFSKGHASPLMYALYGAAGVLSEEKLKGYRTFESDLEGHPTANFKYAEAATGSLGQGLSIGLGMALALKGENSPKVYVLMGDSETAEGSVWEAVQSASFYKVDNLVGIVDVNRLGQSGETMLGWNTQEYKSRFEAFGWETFVIDGHNLGEISKALENIESKNGKPKMIIAKTVKGKGVSFLENKEGWHGKALNGQQYKQALEELGEIDQNLRGEIKKPSPNRQNSASKTAGELKAEYKFGEEVATRKAFGEALVQLGEADPRIVSLDAEVKNSTFSELFNDKFPERFFEIFIAEQNMVGVAVGMAKVGKVPFASSFGVFFTRAFDQIRMASYSRANVKFVGSHAGVSIGEDGPSQMALQDIAMFRTIEGSNILCPADAVATVKLVGAAAENPGIFYIRTNRPATPVIYKEGEDFKIGGSKVVRSTSEDRLTVVACGITLIEALAAADELEKEDINVRVVDAYSIKPIDAGGIRKAASETDDMVITVEDHYAEGGLGDAVCDIFAYDGKTKVFKLAVTKTPRSGKSAELLDWEGISRKGIIRKIRDILKDNLVIP